MATYSRPGVYIQEVPLPQAVTVVDNASAVGAFCGSLPQGPTDAPVLVSTWSQFTKTFGGLNDAYPTSWAAYNFFANHGTSLYVKRVVTSSALKSAVTINDGSGTSNVVTATVTAASVPVSNTITYTAANTYTAGQSVTITGLGATATPTVTSATINGTGTSTTVTWATASTTGIVVGSIVTVAGVTGATTGSFNGTYYVSAVTANTSFTAAVASPATIAGTAVFTGATFSVVSGYNITGTINVAGLTSSAFAITVTPTASQTLPTAALTAQTGTASGTVVTASNNSFTLTALNAGSWANSYSAQVTPAGVSSRFNLTIFATTTSSGVTSTSIVERYSDLSMSSTDANYIGSVIPAYSAVVSVGSIDSTKNPYTLNANPTSLSGGTDGTAPTLSDYTTGWTTFDSVSNSIVVYAPDAPYASTSSLCSQLHGAAVTYAAGRTDAFAVIDTPSGLANSTAAQASVSATATNFYSSTSGGIAAAYWPWYNIPDPNKVIGALRLQAPGAGVVGQYLSTDALRSPAKSPAGLSNKMALAVSTEHLFTNAELDSINTSVDPINPIRQVPGSGIVIMGARTMDNTPVNRYINIRRSLIYIEKQMQNLSSFALFENNDSRLWSKLQTLLSSFLFNYWNSGGLRGSSPAQAYYVKVDATTTSFTDVQAGIVNIEVGVALQYPAEFVVIKLGQLTGNASA